MKWLFLLILFSSLSLNSAMLIIDTGNNDPYLYNTLTAFATLHGMSFAYKHFYEIDPEDIADYSEIVMSIDPLFLSMTARELSAKHKIKNSMLRHIYHLIDHLSKQQNKTIMLLFPTGSSNPVSLFTVAYQILVRLGMQKRASREAEPIIKEILGFLLQSAAGKGRRYDTALLFAKEKKDHLNNNLNAPLIEPKIIHDKNNAIRVASLPLQSDLILDTWELQPLYPLGLYVKNNVTHNQFFITTHNMLQIASIQENFTLNPVSLELRKKLLVGYQRLFDEFMAAIQNKLSTAPLESCPLPLLLTPSLHPIQRKDAFLEREKVINRNRYDWIQEKGIACGWMGIHPFYEKEEKVAENILKSGLNMLWLQLNPELFFAKNATQEAKKDEFLRGIKRFTGALDKVAKKLNKEVPHIFVGMEITGNFGSKPVTDPAIDIYGNVYDKIPSLLDFQEVWKAQVLDVFDQFYKVWKEDIGSGLPLGGVFFDFEMYHAPKQVGQFLSLMDFSNTAWNIFLEKTGKKSELASLYRPKDRIQYLFDHKLLSDYFALLRQKAVSIGKKIKNHILKALPNGVIAGYNINLPCSWFYQGIIEGLSSAKEPFVLATFNNDFYSHYSFLKKNNMYLYHLPVILFSKLQTEEDFQKIPYLWHQHDGVWFNRFSRLEEQRETESGQWDYHLETTPLKTETVISLMKEWIEKGRQRMNTKKSIVLI